MTHILIIEDEAIAAQHLQRTLLGLMPDAEIHGVLQSIEETVEYFGPDGPASNGNMPDVVFMDIHLADGLAFRIFDQVGIPCPIIFTTAYDQYALDAFRAGSLDYLLKPITEDNLGRALDKLRRLGLLGRSRQPVVAKQEKSYHSHFLIPMRDKLIPVDISKIACFYLEDKLSHAVLFDGHSQVIDKPLDSIMEMLNPDVFYRANRQHIVAHNAIRDINLWALGKLALTLCVDTPDRIIISKAKVNEFKQWYTK